MAEQAALTVTVTFFPRSMYTTSPATGTDAPAPPLEDVDHVLVEFQFPEATEYLLAEYPINVVKMKRKARRNLKFPALRREEAIAVLRLRIVKVAKFIVWVLWRGKNFLSNCLLILSGNTIMM